MRIHTCVTHALREAVRRRQPHEPLLCLQVEQVKDLVSLEAVIYWMHKANIVVFYDWSVEVDPRNPRKSALYLMQGGITLPSPDYYTDPSPSMAAKRAGYRRVAEQVLGTVCGLMKDCDMDKWPR